MQHWILAVKFTFLLHASAFLYIEEFALIQVRCYGKRQIEMPPQPWNNLSQVAHVVPPATAMAVGIGLPVVTFTTAGSKLSGPSGDAGSAQVTPWECL
ncbi:UNVERIFIED_CONTAM: hypothetical protein K2H54_044276 [Gekko kuhli]